MNKKQRLLIVDDDESFRYIICVYLTDAGFDVSSVSSGKTALQFLQDSGPVDLIISDHFMPGMDGLELLKQIKKQFGDIPFIIATAHGAINRAVILLKEGANDYLLKPVDQDELIQVVKRSLAYRDTSLENRRLKFLLDSHTGSQSIQTRSPAMLKTLQLAEKVSQSPSTTVALYGESGTGKEVLSRIIHSETDQSNGPFVAINCAAIPDGLIESELFGHVKGAFTGADSLRTGKFELAAKGTILLDEIGEMPLRIQVKLLRVLQEREFEKTGSNTLIPLNARVICSTHQDLEKLVRKKQFREDLFHRISVFPITVPPLRDRKEDIPIFARFFLDLFNQQTGKKIQDISAKALDLMTAYPWPGNVREFKNCIERAFILAEGISILPEHLSIRPLVNQKPLSASGTIDLRISIDRNQFSLDAIVDKVLQMSLEEFNQNKTLTANYLKVNRKIFYRRNL